MEKMSMSFEDYLEAIVMLGGTTERPVRSVDIANELAVSKASVSKAVNALKARGFVEQERYGDVTLTQEGYSYGQSVLERHDVLTSFMIGVLGIAPDVAEEEACKMEHAISDDSFEKWKTFIKSL